MSDKTAAASADNSPDELRGTLIKRLAVAGLLVAVLLGVLAFFDYLAAPEEPEPTVYTKPVPVPPKKEVTQPVKPAVDLPEPPKPDAQPEKETEASATAEPPKPEVNAKPEAQVQAVAPDIRPESKAAPAVRPALAAAAHPPTPTQASSPALGPSARPVATPRPVPEAPTAPKAAAPAEAAPALATPSAVQQAAKPVEPASVRLQPVTPHLFSGYVLQAGVFSNVQRAEELHAKLTLNGIPSTLEARVQVGPFKNKAEADAAREKMQSLGIDTVLIPPKAARR